MLYAVRCALNVVCRTSYVGSTRTVAGRDIGSARSIICEADTYLLEAAPGVDLALMVMILAALDSMFNERDKSPGLIDRLID
jgi:hypothetical protein